MDPNEVYARLVELAATSVPVRDDPAQTKALAMQMQAAFVALDEWIRRGGFLPRAWKSPTPPAAHPPGNPALASVMACSLECTRLSCLTYSPTRSCTYTTRELKELTDDGS